MVALTASDPARILVAYSLSLPLLGAWDVMKQILRPIELTLYLDVPDSKPVFSVFVQVLGRPSRIEPSAQTAMTV